MCNRIDIDDKDNQAIRREIGERLSSYYLRVKPELPTSLRKQVNRFYELEGQSPSIVPEVEHEFDRAGGNLKAK